MDQKRFSRAKAALAQVRQMQRTDLGLGCISALLLLAVLISFVLYLRFSFEIYPTLNFNSDDASALLFSNEVLKQHSLFPTWYNSTGIWIPFLSPELALLPMLLAISNHWMACFRTAVLLDQLVMSTLIWWLLGRVGLSRALRLFLLCFLFASVSSQMAEQTVMVAGQDWFYTKLLLLSFLVSRSLQSSRNLPGTDSWNYKIWIFAIGLLLFIDKSNISQMLPPITVALMMQWVALGERSERPILMAFVYLAAAAICGQLVFHYLLTHAVAYHHIAPRFVDLDSAGGNFLLLLRGLMDLFGAVPPEGRNIYSHASILWALKLGLLCICFIGPIFLFTRWRKIESDFLRFLVAVFIVSLMLHVLVYVFTGISVGVTATNRYFISLAFTGLTVMLLYFDMHWRTLPLRAGTLVVAMMLIAGSPLLLPRPSDGSVYHKLARFLESRHLNHGYATFWNAGVLTALADNRVQVRQTVLENGGIQPFRWLSSSRWYQGNPDIHESFLLLRGGERIFNMGLLAPVLGRPVRVEDFGDYRALVFPFDLAQRLGWKYSVDEKLPPADRRAALIDTGTPVWSEINSQWAVTIRVTNLSKVPIGSNGQWPVNLGAHLLGPKGQLLENDYIRVVLPMIAPGMSTTLSVEMPDKRAGGNFVEFDLVQEGVAWFGSTGNPTLRVHVPLLPPPMRGTTSTPGDDGAQRPVWPDSAFAKLQRSNGQQLD